MKRTLTDKQIAIFRHSEIQNLLRERRRAEEARADGESDIISTPVAEEGELEDGLLGSDVVCAETPMPPPSKHERAPTKKARKAQQAKQKGFFKQNVKPDLRKRTWDKVDTGIGSLDYDEETSAPPAQGHASQRRRISYDDD